LVFAGVSTARAAPVDGDLPLMRPCMLIGNPGADAVSLIRDSASFDCKRDPHGTLSDTIWIRYDVSHDGVDGSTGWTYDHATFQARAEQVWIGYADGRVRPTITSREDARRVFGGPTQRFDFAKEAGHITALLIRVDGLASYRGPVPRASLTSHERTEANKARYYLAFGIMAGVMLGIFFYNMTLFVALRYRVLGAYCGSIAATLFYGTVWSNLILWFWPGMTTTTQYAWNVLSISIDFLAASFYYDAFVEPGMVPRRIMRAIQATATFTVVMSAMLIFARPLSWQATDALLYVSYCSIIALTLVGGFIAWRRGSRAIRYFLLAWSIPIAVVLQRIAWAVGGAHTENAILDASPFVSLSIEALMSAVGLSWRLGKLRNERDEARDLADIDPLTGLLNRRSFVARALDEDLPKRLVLIDIDYFKSINDRFGHQQGDDVLCHLATLLRDHGPPGALVGRLGGEEFAVLVRADIAPTLGETLRRAVANSRFPHDIKVTVSAGFAIAKIKDETSWRAIYSAADEALYAAKRSGRNTVRETRMALAA
jgi:diguanylate cyclase (GGDEF)-like protein